ncbi:MAG: hypothetical protein HQL60_05785 [Magnetococcales bacterium]|nr:hypothetical protein [Magnetococcales bacterium]
MNLKNGSKVAIIGGGPAGAMAGFFMLELASRIGLHVTVDIYEARDFSKVGPSGCNMCAGVVSESLVQILAAEGINLPPTVVQRGIDSYVLHTSDLDPIAIRTPLDELRIATVYRGGGPRRPSAIEEWSSFDRYLLNLAQERGASIHPQRVVRLDWDNQHPRVTCRDLPSTTYDLLIGAVGVNSGTLHLFEEMGFSFKAPQVSKGFLSELHLGADLVQQYMGNSMHIFLLDIPGLKFAAMIPKVEYVTVCLLGEDINKDMVNRFMNAPEVRSCLPQQFDWCLNNSHCALVGPACHCAPKLNTGPSIQPYHDRVVLVGDCAVSRLYKDGIGAAYVTAKSAVVTAIFFGIASKDFAAQYRPVFERINYDNRFGRFIFLVTVFYQKWRFLRHGMARMVHSEQLQQPQQRLMSRALWDTFTGSTTYIDIFLRAIHPRFLFRLIWATLLAVLQPKRKS